MTILLGILGLVVVTAPVLAGRDLRRASRNGPRWKRSLIAAGLFLLAAAGTAQIEKLPNKSK